MNFTEKCSVFFNVAWIVPFLIGCFIIASSFYAGYLKRYNQELSAKRDSLVHARATHAKIPREHNLPKLPRPK